MENIQFENEVITLGQFLKQQAIIASGGEAKMFLHEYNVYLNGELESRRGKKLHHGDLLNLGEFGEYRIEYIDETF